VSADEVSQLQKIERLIKKSIPREEIEGFEPEHRLPTKPVKSSGKRPSNKTSGKRPPNKTGGKRPSNKAKAGAKKHRGSHADKRQGGQSAKSGGRNRKPARASA
jgi:ATP-dependent RNA helicase RhlE